MLLRFVLPALVIFAMGTLHPRACLAGSFEVAPTTITLSADAPTGMLHVTNRSKETVFAQIEAFDWHQDNNAEQLISSQNLMVSPPMARLLPGQAQTVRIMGNIHDKNQQEQTFRLVISELPDPSSKKQGVNVLLQFVVPVFIGSLDPPPQKVQCITERDQNGTSIALYNAGFRHLKLAGITGQLSGGGEIPLTTDAFNYILPGALHHWAIPPGNAITAFNAQDENLGEVHAPCIEKR